MPGAETCGSRVSSRDLHELIGRRVRVRRRQLGLTQAQVAALCDTSFQQIQKLEAGELGISVLRLIKLAAALQVPPDYLYQ
jgi:transcriptional regulator with XRE-family HTH domain